MTKHRYARKTAILDLPYELYFKPYGLPQPVVEHKFDPTRKFMLDLAWPRPMLCKDKDIAIEVQGGIWRLEGGAHQGTGHVRDMRKINLAQRHGWIVFQFEPEDVRNGQAAAWLLQCKEEWNGSDQLSRDLQRTQASRLRGS